MRTELDHGDAGWRFPSPAPGEWVLLLRKKLRTTSPDMSHGAGNTQATGWGGLEDPPPPECRLQYKQPYAYPKPASSHHGVFQSLDAPVHHLHPLLLPGLL